MICSLFKVGDIVRFATDKNMQAPYSGWRMEVMSITPMGYPIVRLVGAPDTLPWKHVHPMDVEVIDN